MSRKPVLILAACMVAVVIALPTVCVGAPRDRVNGEVVFNEQRVAGVTRTYRSKIMAAEGQPGLLESGYTCNDPACAVCTSGGWHLTKSDVLLGTVVDPGVATFYTPGPVWMRIVDGGGDSTTDKWFAECSSATRGLTGGWPIPMLSGNFNVHAK